MHWWMSIIFMALYAVYILQLWGDARSYQRAHDAIAEHLDQAAGDVSVAQLDQMLRDDGIKVPRALIDQIRTAHRAAADGDDEEPLPATAGILFGYAQIPLSHLAAWGVIAVCTLIAAVACYWLVAVTRATAEQLEVPIFFVAVIVAAAASSVPDTFLSIAAARHGDDSGAVSNAFGSNIFDICICLSIPLLISAYLNGWQPVALLEDGKPLPGLFGIRVLMCVLTVVTLLIMWHRHQLTRVKALVLCGLYALFVAYAVAGSLGIRFLGYDL
jgi:cation:H+ antiporter